MKIAYGDSRTAKKWKNNEISWADFCKRVSTTQYTTETVEEYRKMTKARLNKFSAYKKLASITVGYLDMETMNIVDTQMYIDGYQVKLVSDTSYGSLWEVSFTLKEF